MKAVRQIDFLEQIVNLELKAIDGIMGIVISIDGPFFENKNKEELREIYSYEIDELFVGWKHISNIASNIKGSMVFLLPEFISEKNLNEASIYISGKYRDEEIFIEFGPFTGGGKGPNYCHYYYKNLGGLRISKTTFQYWKNNIVDDYIKLSHKNMTVKNLLDRVTENFTFSAENFRVYGNNGNFFVAKCIKAINGKRFNGRNARGIHTLGVSRIPAKILEALEENEDDTTSTIGNIPILGKVFDFGQALGSLFTN